MTVSPLPPDGPSCSGGLLWEALDDLPSSGRVLVAMSGGVDSTAAALLLQRKDLELQAVTFRFVAETEDDPASPVGSGSIERARSVCRTLGIPHRVADYTRAFREAVIDPFYGEYAAGRTPNPCVRCNASIKWPAMLEQADRLGCDYVATGHYARIIRTGDRQRILRGRDRRKDQSYALYALGQDMIRRTLFPVGNLAKSYVRSLVEEARLGDALARESQDICFVPRGTHRTLLARRLSPRPGPVVDLEGRVLGTHRGLPFYTVGQRKGLGIPLGAPMYVIEIDPEANRLVLGPRSALCKRTFRVTDVNWVSLPPPLPGSVLEAEVEVRYRARPIPGRVKVLGPETAEIHLLPHEQAVAPGQSAVWYRGEVLVGGGVIRP